MKKFRSPSQRTCAIEIDMFFARICDRYYLIIITTTTTSFVTAEHRNHRVNTRDDHTIVLARMYAPNAPRNQRRKTAIPAIRERVFAPLNRRMSAKAMHKSAALRTRRTRNSPFIVSTNIFQGDLHVYPIYTCAIIQRGFIFNFAI